jgi:hypothetical protein
METQRQQTAVLPKKQRKQVKAFLDGLGPPAPKWEKWSGTIPTSKGPLAVEGDRYGPFLVRKVVSRGDNITADAYQIDHIPTGAYIHALPLGGSKLAKGLVVDLFELRLVDWYKAPPAAGESSPQMIQYLIDKTTEEFNHTVARPRIRKEMQEKNAKKKGGVSSAIGIMPIYPSFFTPSIELEDDDQFLATYLHAGLTKNASNKALTALVPETIVRASQALWRETMMARFTAGTRAPALESDIPPAPPVNLRLPPGFPTGYEGVSKIIKGLWKLGSELHALADCMINMWETVEGDPTEPYFNDQQFMAWHHEYRRLIQKGWGNWALAAAMYEALPAADKAKITDTLGFVGDKRQGYHQLGIKTFLRSPLLPKARLYRRLYEAKWEGQSYEPD